jgi:hypothetical protein
MNTVLDKPLKLKVKNSNQSYSVVSFMLIEYYAIFGFAVSVHALHNYARLSLTIKKNTVQDYPHSYPDEY